MARPLPLALIGATLLAAPVMAGCGSSSKSDNAAAAPATSASTTSTTTPAAGGPISVKLTEWGVTPSASSAKAGKVTFDVTNDGKTTHEFVVIRTDKPDGKLGSGARVPEKGNVGEVGDLKAGATGKVTIDLKPGAYQLICNLPGHYMSGMHTSFRVS